MLIIYIKQQITFILLVLVNLPLFYPVLERFGRSAIFQTIATGFGGRSLNLLLFLQIAPKSGSW